MSVLGVIDRRLQMTTILLVAVILSACGLSVNNRISAQQVQGANISPSISAVNPANPKAGDAVSLSGTKFPTRKTNLVARVVLADSGTKDSALTVTSASSATFTIPTDAVGDVKTILMLHEGKTLASYDVSPASIEMMDPPTFTPAAGTYDEAQSVAITSTQQGVTIYYTIDGSTPTTSSAVYSAAISIESSKTIKAYAVKTGFKNSEIATAAYVINSVVAPPSTNVAVGAYLTARDVTLSSATSGAAVHYNTGDGTQVPPTCSNGSTTMPIAVTASITIKAVACKTGYTVSALEIFPYTIGGVASDPVISVTNYTTKTIQMTSATAGASIYYTIDNSSPSADSTLYTGPVSFTGAPTIKAIASKAGYSSSAVTIYDFNFDATRDYAAPSVNYMRHFKTGDNLNGWHQDPGTTLATISASPAGGPNSTALMANPGMGMYSDNGYGQGAELPDLTRDFTIEMWLYVDSFVDGDLPSPDPGKRAKIQILGGDFGYPMILSMNTDRSLSICEDCANLQGYFLYSSSSASVIQLQTWQHIAVVGKVGSGVKTFVDGLEVNSINRLPADNGEGDYGNSFPAGNLTMFTGHDFDSFANVFVSNMRMSQVARYGTAFTPKFVNFANYGGVRTQATTLLLHMDGANNSTTITDSAAAAHSASVDGTQAKISTTQSKFGGSSAYFDGSSGIQVSRSADLAFGGENQDFTIEMWLHPTANHSCNVFFESRAPGSVGAPGFGINAANDGPTAFEDGIAFYDEMIGASNPSTAGIALNTWSHFALVRHGSTVTYYINGVASGSQMFTFSGDALNPSAEEGYIRLGAIKDGYNHPYNYVGYMDEVRINNGLAVYTSNFTPATSAFTATTTYNCYANGVLTSDLDVNGTGTCSGDGRTYINGVGQ